MTDLVQNLAVGGVLVCAAGMLMVPSRRWITGLLALQYIGVFLLVGASWPLEIAVVKLVAGWMAAAVLFITYQKLPEFGIENSEPGSMAAVFFRGFAALLVAVSVYSLVPVGTRWFLGASFQQVLGGLWLMGLGLLHLGLSRDPLRITAGLLAVMSGFEILYASLEASVLMTGLLAILNLGLAFTGAYIFAASSMEGNL